jgi:hypothetical protein
VDPEEEVPLQTTEAEEQQVLLPAGVRLSGIPASDDTCNKPRPLGVGGGAIWRVPSLSAPDTDRLPAAGGLTRYDAVRLFLDRARLHPGDLDVAMHHYHERPEVRVGPEVGSALVAR